MSGYLEWIECDNCGYESACLDVNTKTGEENFYCKKCGKTENSEGVSKCLNCLGFNHNTWDYYNEKKCKETCLFYEN